jgi:excisionase family DNA binding protein
MLDFIRFPYNIGIYLFARMNFMFEYMSTQEAAEQWGISERRIQKLCEQKRIEGVVRFGHLWTIPTDAIKPVDERRKENKLFSTL